MDSRHAFERSAMSSIVICQLMRLCLPLDG
jgi:hypothetical protein